MVLPPDLESLIQSSSAPAGLSPGNPITWTENELQLLTNAFFIPAVNATDFPDFVSKALYFIKPYDFIGFVP